MAKFAIALCILVVACGAQGSILSSIMNPATEVLKSILAQAEAQKAKVSAAMVSMMDFHDSQLRSLSNAVETAMAEWEAQIASLGATNDLGNCVSSNINFTSLLDGMIAETTECAATSTTAMKTEYAKVEAKIDEFIAKIKSIITQFEACDLPSIISTMRCWATMKASVESTPSTELATIQSEAEAFVSTMASVVTLSQPCDYTLALITLSAEAALAYPAIQTCATSTGSTTNIIPTTLIPSTSAISVAGLIPTSPLTSAAGLIPTSSVTSAAGLIPTSSVTSAAGLIPTSSVVSAAGVIPTAMPSATGILSLG